MIEDHTLTNKVLDIKLQPCASDRRVRAKISSSSVLSNLGNITNRSINVVPDRANNNKLYYVFYKISVNPYFGILLIALIIFNTIVLALDRYPIDPSEAEIFNVINDILSWCFFLEMFIKIIGVGVIEYAKDKFNLFDCVVVIVSTVENIIQYVGIFLSGGTISALRALRLLRVFKLARSWSSFRKLLEKIIVSIKDISNFSILLFLFIFVYTLLGMELFAY